LTGELIEVACDKRFTSTPSQGLGTITSTPRTASSASTSPTQNRCAASWRLNMASMWQSVSPQTIKCACRQRCPTAEAVPHDSNPSGIEVHLRIPRGAIQQLIEEKAHIWHTVRNPGFHSRSLLLTGLTFSPRQFRRYDFRVIECADVPMAAQVGTKKGRLSTSTSAAMRKDDQRVGSGLCRGIADSHLAPWRVAGRNGEEVPLGSTSPPTAATVAWSVVQPVLCALGWPSARANPDGVGERQIERHGRPHRGDEADHEACARGGTKPVV
jgi:hypothetical protein